LTSFYIKRSIGRAEASRWPKVASSQEDINDITALASVLNSAQMHVRMLAGQRVEIHAIARFTYKMLASRATC